MIRAVIDTNVLASGLLSPSGNEAADSKFIACAHAAKAEFIVTGNKRDFPRCAVRIHPGGECR